MKTMILAFLTFYGSTILASPTINLDIPAELYSLKDSQWNEALISEKINQANQILKDCSLTLKPISPVLSISGLESNGSVNLLSDLNPNFKSDETKLHQSLSTTRGAKIIRMLFTGTFVNLIGTFGVSRRHELHAGEIYENAIYISDQMGFSEVDSTIAHELGHLLLNKGHYSLDPSPNIMQGSYFSQNKEFNKTQCAVMRQSFLVQ